MKRRLIPLFALAAVGCLERNEEITVKADGSADVVVTYSGDPGDFNDLLVMPEGWKVGKKVEGDKTVWTARGTVRDLKEYPNRDVNFPYETRLRITTTGTVRTYDFERTYPQMDARDFQAVDDALWQRDESKKLMARLHEKGITGLTDDEQRRLFEIAAEAEREKQMAVVARAMHSLKDLSWRARIDALARVEAEYREKLTGATLSATIGKRLETLDKFDALARGLRDRAAALVPGLGPKLETAATEMRAALAVSDDSFKLTVKLPGEVVAGNATWVNGGAASWEFAGKDLGAQPIILRATSVETVK